MILGHGKLILVKFMIISIKTRREVANDNRDKFN